MAKKKRRLKPLLRTPDVLERFQIGRTTLNRWVRTGLFPAGVRVGPSRLLFWEEEVIENVHRSIIRKRKRPYLPRSLGGSPE